MPDRRSTRLSGTLSPFVLVACSSLPVMTQDARELHDRLRKEDQSFMSDFEMTVVETSNPALRRWALPEKRRVTITRVDDVRGIQTELLDPGIPKYIKNAESIDYDDGERLLLWRHSEHRGYKDAEYSGHWRALVLYRIAPDDKVTEAQSPHRTVDRQVQAFQSLTLFDHRGAPERRDEQRYSEWGR